MTKHGCELLSNCIFISVFDNCILIYTRITNVVNCFQIVFLYRSLTTIVQINNVTLTL